mmetsp:Transcript_91827/g.248111  ORF Transcript_91827/g.248111 Transcript_91827/m.248111 type:complete len:145 (-) Transcript_91827:100-534(-)
MYGWCPRRHGCHTHLVASVAGYETAYRLLLTGDVVTGEEACRLRLASQLEPDGASAVDAAMELAARMAAQGPLALRATVRSLRQKQDEGLALALRREADAQSQHYGSPDFAEGLAAVAEKRKPNFTMYESYTDAPLPPTTRSKL